MASDGSDELAGETHKEVETGNGETLVGAVGVFDLRTDGDADHGRVDGLDEATLETSVDGIDVGLTVKQLLVVISEDGKGLGGDVWVPSREGVLRLTDTRSSKSAQSLELLVHKVELRLFFFFFDQEEESEKEGEGDVRKRSFEQRIGKRRRWRGRRTQCDRG